MTRGVLQNYIKASPKTGRLSYRRRIPTKLNQHFTKPDGSLRGLEWNEKLETKSISIALRKATIINDRFERTKAMAQQLVIASKAESELTQTQQLEEVIRYFRKMGIHPDQAPDIFAPATKANAFLAKTAKAQRELMDFQEEVGIEVSGDPHIESYATNKRYDAIQAQIDFLSGDRSKIKDLLRPSVNRRAIRDLIRGVKRGHCVWYFAALWRVCLSYSERVPKRMLATRPALF